VEAGGGKLTGSGESYGGDFGLQVALSGDGGTALVGAPYAGHFGGAWVFVRDGSGWREEGPRLVGSGSSDTVVGFGVGLALSADGDTAAVGGSNYKYAKGAVWIFTRAQGVWRQQARIPEPADATGPSAFGIRVGLSANGDTMVVAAFVAYRGRGAAWLYARSDGAWVRRGGAITAPVVLGKEPRFASSLALAQDGTTVIIGGPNEENGKGAAWVYEFS
jgi:hypothetical protein